MLVVLIRPINVLHANNFFPTSSIWIKPTSNAFLVVLKDIKHYSQIPLGSLTPKRMDLLRWNVIQLKEKQLLPHNQMFYVQWVNIIQKFHKNVSNVKT